MNAAVTAQQPHRTCPDCGSRIDSTESAGFGCAVCLLRAGLGEASALSGRDEVPHSLGDYAIARHEDGALWELGRGAMGITYRAQDMALQREVAVKVIRADLRVRGAEARARFTREARAAAVLRHPNIAMVHQFGIDDASGHSFYAMELVEGETLEERVRRSGPLPAREVVEIARQVAAALAAAEKRGLVHRDLKPANIMLAQGEKDGELVVKVIDFGLAKALAETPDPRGLTHGGFVGSPAFSSPEQLSSEPVDVRSDIYSLGVTLWYLLTGRMPFADRDATQPPPIKQLKAPHVPARFVSLLVRMLASEPAARPSTNELEKQLSLIQRQLKGSRTMAWSIAAVATIALLAGWGFYRNSAAPFIPDKSIAVLPFASFGDNKEDVYLADGLQDDILTDLAKVADLKVISRRSVEQYRGTRESIRDIGRALRVAYVLEGSLRKVGDKFHVTEQLIDTRTEAENWGDKYELALADVFNVQRQVSQVIVARLKANISSAEKSAIDARPTEDEQAYDLYLRARLLVRQMEALASTLQTDVPKAIALLESAIARDPGFTRAYCLLSEAHLNLFNIEFHNYDELPKAKMAAEAALRLAPESGEAHLAMAQYLYQGAQDNRAARLELAMAAKSLPGDVAVHNLGADLAEEAGHWREALLGRRKALQLDPSDTGAAVALVRLYMGLRWYRDAEKLTDQMLNTMPQQEAATFWRWKARIAVARGNTEAALAAYDSHPFRHSGLYGLNNEIARVFFLQQHYDKAEEIWRSCFDVARARHAMPRGGDNPAAKGHMAECLGTTARIRGQAETARGYFESARADYEAWLAANAQGATTYEAQAAANIAALDAGLGRKDQAIEEAARVLQTWPQSRNAVIAGDISIPLATAYLWAGDRDAALRLLEQRAKLPYGPSAGELALDPVWDELQSESRFKQVVKESTKPISL